MVIMESKLTHYGKIYIFFPPSELLLDSDEPSDYEANKLKGPYPAIGSAPHRSSPDWYFTGSSGPLSVPLKITP